MGLYVGRMSILSDTVAMALYVGRMSILSDTVVFYSDKH